MDPVLQSKNEQVEEFQRRARRIKGEKASFVV